MRLVFTHAFQGKLAVHDVREGMVIQLRLWMCSVC